MAVRAHDQHLSDHYVICGYGRIGSIVAAEFARQKTPFVIVDRDPARVTQANQHGHLAVEGDASREDTLKTVGIETAVVDFVEIATSSDNLELSIEEIRVESGSPMAERPLSEVIQRDKMNVIVVGIQRAHGRMEFNPARTDVLNAGDHLIVLGSASTLKEIERAAK